jgi:nucleotide-binding universal stress UspA family protein
MTPFRSILAATDFSVDGNNAVRRAALLARQHDARLRILHVVNPAGFKPLRGWYRQSSDIDLETAQARATLRRFAAEIAGRHDVVAKIEVRVGDVDAELLRASEDVDLLVLGERGKNPLKDLVIGKTADRLLRTCRTPLLVVKQAVQGPYRRVLVPVDFTPSSNAAIRSAAALATGVGIQLFHALSSTREAVLREADVPATVIRESRATEEAGAGARMRRSVASLGLDSRSMSFALGRGPVVASTLRQAQKLDADMIVAGKQRRSTVAGFFLGSAGSRLLAASRCDALIVPHPLRVPHSSSAGGSPWPADHNAVIDTARRGRGAAALAGALTSAQEPAAATHAGQSGARGPAWAAVARVYP